MKRSMLRFLVRYGNHIRETIKLSLPVIIGQIGIVMMGVLDNVMVGVLGYKFLSAASLGNSVFFILVVLGMGMTFAISPLVAEAEAAKSPDACGRYLRQGVWVAIATAAIIGILMLGATFLLPYLGQPEQDVKLATPYLYILNISVLPMLLFLVYKQFSDGLSLTRPAMYITLIGLAFNGIGNWVFINGYWGFPRWELNGAGVATLLSRILMFVLMAGYIMRAKKFGIYHPRFRWREINFPVIRKIVSIGLPSGMQYFFEVGAFGGAVIMAGWLGMVDRSAHQIVINLSSVTYMVVSGIAAGAAIRVGTSLGHKDTRSMRQAGMAGVYLGAFIMVFFSLILVIGRNWFPSLYVKDLPVLEVASRLMIIAAFFQIFDGIQAVGIGILRGIQDVRVPTLITFVAYWVLALPIGYFLGFYANMGIDGLWYGFVAGLAMAAVALTFRFWFLTGPRAVNS
ncbi:MAG: MATE family efflux transporter [Bacteroidia bacterium]|nr:MATE family efflux transporter [Bacteroidia bacterium]